MNEAIEIHAVGTVDGEIVDAMARLLPELTPSPGAPSADELQEIVASPCTTLLLARDRGQGGRIVGTLTLALFRTPTGPRVRIEDVVVEPAARGKGIGEALTRSALTIAAARGAVTVELTSQPSREAANRLYRRLGFSIHETNVYLYLFGADVPDKLD